MSTPHNPRLVEKRYREHRNAPRPTWRDTFAEWLVNNYLLDVVVMREDYETFRNNAFDWIAEGDRSRLEVEIGRVRELEQIIYRLTRENHQLVDAAMHDMGFDKIKVTGVVFHEVQRFQYRLEMTITNEELYAVRHPADKSWLQHIFRYLMRKCAEQFKEIVKKLPIDDAQKTASELHDEVFDPTVTDLEYFERRRRYHGLR